VIGGVRLLCRHDKSRQPGRIPSFLQKHLA
jgi:hypothetical protein